MSLNIHAEVGSIIRIFSKDQRSKLKDAHSVAGLLRAVAVSARVAGRMRTVGSAKSSYHITFIVTAGNGSVESVYSQHLLHVNSRIFLFVSQF